MPPDWSALLAPARAEAERFATALADPAAAQRALLADILSANASTEFGRKHGFARIEGMAAYRTAVPVSDYEARRGDIDRVAGGQADVLTAEPVIAFEETGGTSSGAKLIPYTANGLAGFRRAVLPWLADIARRRPALAQGRVYVTISPATRQPRTTPGGIPIGLATDAAYLGADLAPAFAALLAVPGETGAIPDPVSWQLVTLQALVLAEDLSFVSLWSPTFLLALLDGLEARADEVLAVLDPHQRQRLERALGGPALDTAALWPRLDCISCWTDGASTAFASRLGEAFPHAAIEPKGLLATEAAVTVPWGDSGACVPALRSAVIEFIDANGDAHLCDGLIEGEPYRVVVTTASGLYRHDLGDMVTCTAIRSGVPALRFAGRGDGVVDLVGEKLTESFVAAALAALPAPAVLVAAHEPPGYVLVCEARFDAPTLAGMEGRLAANPQYAHARAIGQLARLRAVHRPHLSRDLTQAALAAGRRMGDLKPVALLDHGAGGWLTR